MANDDASEKDQRVTVAVLGERVSNLSKSVDTLAETTRVGFKAMDDRLERMDLNGSTDSLKMLAKYAPQIVAAFGSAESLELQMRVQRTLPQLIDLVDEAPTLVTMVEAFKRNLIVTTARRGWVSPLINVIKLIGAGAAGALGWTLVNNFWHLAVFAR